MLVLLYHRSVNIIYIYISVTRSHTTESRYENNIGAACGSPNKRFDHKRFSSDAKLLQTYALAYLEPWMFIELKILCYSE